jgi:hypothetical protein
VSAIIACAFPVFVALALLRLFPIRIPERLTAPDPQQGSNPTRNTAPLCYGEHLAYTAPYLVGWLIISYPLAVAQRALLTSVGRDGSTFSYRATDIPIYSFVPAFFLGLGACIPIYVRLLEWYLGPRFLDLLDRPDRSRVPMSLRQEIHIFPVLVWTVAILATLLNLAAFDTFLQVTGTQFNYYCLSNVLVEYALL